MNYYDNFNVLYRYVRAYILHLFDSVLFIDLTGRYVTLIYLMFMEDFDIIPTYSWGSVILACLYRHPCLTCMKEVKQVGRCLLLLQVWSKKHYIDFKCLLLTHPIQKVFYWITLMVVGTFSCRRTLVTPVIRGVQTNRITEKTEKTEENLTEKTEPRWKID